ncbi:hypothetical protein COU95_00390 [Candidatus Shapirobacteria bacterium CG10_big_fil_rev_8_21_14_0_10_40_9]|uniref:Glycosyl transferase family 1 domain-containing protein n=1 Tax=Candidatus Shapirobacteria bacterium CG10_big_fil_rev_8_21_14_0_10_40_9 TaxID=1974888 RepID=A0A2M8L4F7_9BACT|nr:MAG: hypothetical protein COU95_00390 [Candidatus Shapirobacteria bacterium CG10_big_fil_rev_8_21_14_0_10_40_9]
MQPLLLLFTNLGVGGVQRKIVDIVNFLASYKPDFPIYILLRNYEDYDLSPEIKNKNVKIINYQDRIKIRIPFFFPFFEIYQIWRIKPRAILSFLDFVSVPAIWAKLLFFWRRTRLVISEDHYASKIIPNFKFGHLRNFLVKIFYPFADVIFTCSQATKDDLIKNYGFLPKKIKIIRNWTTFAERKIEVKEKKYDLIYIGRLVKVKNISFLIKAFKKIKNLKRDIKLCLIGSGQETENLKRMSRQLGLERHIDFFKPRHDVADFLASSRVFVLCSLPRSEGFPVIVLEAMAVGTPVLACDFAGAREFLRDGQNCYLFRDEDEFIKKTLWLLDHPKERETVADRAYQYVKQYHSPGNILTYLRELKI